MKAHTSPFFQSKPFQTLFALAAVIAGYFCTAKILERKSKGALSVEALSLSSPVYSGPNQSENDTIEAYRRNPKNAPSRVEMLNALANWISADPLSLVNNVSGIVFDSHYQGAFGDSEAALSAASRIEDVKTRHRIIRDAFRDLVSRNPIKALDFASMLPASLRYSESLNLGKELGKHGGNEYMLAAARHENCTANIFTQAMRSWASEHTEEALKFLEQIEAENIPPQRVDKRAIWSALSDAGDAEVRLRYIEKMPPSWDRDGYMTAAKGSILASAPGKWDSMFQTEDSKLLIGKIARDAAYKAVGSAPEDAALFLSRIPNAAQKTEAARAATSNIYVLSKGGKDSAMIESWLRAASDPIIKDAILAELKFQKAPIPKGY